MYEKLEKFLIILSIVLVLSLSLFLVVTKHKQMFAGSDGGVFVLNSKINIKESMNEIAKKKKVLIAKQIMVPSTDGKTDNQPTFQKFGVGTLPKDFPEQKNKEFIENSNDATQYFIIGKNINPGELSNYLNDLGNITIIADTDWKFQGIYSLLDLRMITGVLLFLISYMSILMANIIINLKKQGVQRLAGISIYRLSFSGLKKRLTFMIITVFISLAVCTICLYLLNLRRMMYFYVLIFPAIFWIVALVFVELLVGLLVYIFLKKQKINLVIKDRAPIKLLMRFVFLLQLISLLCLIVSFSRLSSSHAELTLLSRAKDQWASENYYAPSLLMGNSEKYEENLLNFLSEANQKEELLIVADNFNSNTDNEQYYPRSQTDENVIYVTPNYLDKVGIKSNLISNSNMEKDITILIPESQKNNKSELSSLWLKRTSPYDGPLYTSNSDVYKMPSEELFTFRMFSWGAANNRAFVQNPIIIVISPHLFESNSRNFDAGILFSWISREQILFSDNKTTAELIKKHKLETILGSFSNGKFAVATRLMEKKAQQLFIVMSSIIALISSTFLFYLMTKIYLYQNRKKFTIEQISGKSIFDIHKSYLIQLLIIIVFSLVMVVIWHLNPLTFIVPFILGGLQLLLFVKQIKNNKLASISILKGE